MVQRYRQSIQMTETLRMKQPIDSKIFKKMVMDQWNPDNKDYRKITS